MKSQLARANSRVPRHAWALDTSSFLTKVFWRMYRPMGAKIEPKKVIKKLREAGVIGLLLGTHGVGGWRSQARATEDVDLLIRKRDHAKAVQAIAKAFPKLKVSDTPVVTRFLDADTDEPVIDLMKPTDELFKVAFRFSIPVGDSHRVPDLELALATKFAAMVSPFRKRSKKIVDVGDFADIVEGHLSEIDFAKLQKLAKKVYLRGGQEIVKLVRDIEDGRKIEI